MARHSVREPRYIPPPKVIAIQADLFGAADVELVAARRAIPKDWSRDFVLYGAPITAQRTVADPVKPLFLVGCVKTKLPRPAAARDLYASDWFKKARAYVEAKRGDWLILSAQYGVVDPHQVIAPYERTLSKMNAAEREAWGRGVVRQLAQHPGGSSRPLVLLAGANYRAAIETWAGDRASAPMAGMGLGSQKAWLAAI